MFFSSTQEQLFLSSTQEQFGGQFFGLQLPVVIDLQNLLSSKIVNKLN